MVARLQICRRCKLCRSHVSDFLHHLLLLWDCRLFPDRRRDERPETLLQGHVSLPDRRICSLSHYRRNGIPLLRLICRLSRTWISRTIHEEGLLWPSAARSLRHNDDCLPCKFRCDGSTLLLTDISDTSAACQEYFRHFTSRHTPSYLEHLDALVGLVELYSFSRLDRLHHC